MDFLLNLKIVYDNSLIITIISINMTIIGLTSLADTKKIIGIDYGKFLIKKYKVFRIIRFYYLLIMFAIINALSLFVVLLDNNIIRVINFIVLIFSLVFAIYYFFGYIMVENGRVKRQIYNQELLGLYYDSNQVTSFEVDRLVGINNGSRTHKKLSTSLINYFNQFDSETQYAFQEVFGKDSIIYSTKGEMYFKGQNGETFRKYKYRKGVTGVVEISHEFFQLFRFTDLQDKWAIDILRIINDYNSCSNKYDEIRLFNFARMITHINIFGHSKAIYKYKFLEHLADSYYNSVNLLNVKKETLENKNHINEVEEFALNEFISYIVKTIKGEKDTSFVNSSKNILRSIIVGIDYKGILEQKKRFNCIANCIIESDCDITKSLFAELLSELHKHYMYKPPHYMSINSVKQYIWDYKNKNIEGKQIAADILF